MSNYNSLKTTIDASIKQNGRQEIKGVILNSVLNQMVNTLGAGYQFAGVATTATNPGSPDAKVFYIANGKGTYTNFGGIQVTDDDVAILYWDSSWHMVSTGVASVDAFDRIKDSLCIKTDLSDITWTDGFYWHDDLHVAAGSSINSLSGYIKVEGLKYVRVIVNYSISAANACIGFFNANKEWIANGLYDYGASTRSYKEKTFEIPEGCVYMRVSLYTEFKQDWYCYGFEEINFSKIQSVVNKLEFDLYSKNIVVKTWNPGYYSDRTGIVTPSSVNSYSPKIDISGYKKVRVLMQIVAGVSNASTCFYDEDDNFIVGYAPNQGSELSYEYRVFDIPSSAKYVGFTCRTTQIPIWDASVLNDETNRVSDIEKELADLKKTAIVKDKNDILVGSPMLHLSDNITDSYTSINAKTTSELYAEYDAIAQLYPTYFRRLADIGSVERAEDGVSFDIRQYELSFSPKILIDHEPTATEVVTQSTNHWTDSLNYKKILVVGGMHGEEHTPCWGLMLAIKEILESDEDWAIFLKSNFIFKIVPCLNPAGWDLCRRGNCNDVVLNREASINEPETLFYMDWVNENKDAFVLFDNHGSQGRYSYLPTSIHFPWHDMACRLAIKLASSFKSNWGEFYDAQQAGFKATYAPYVVAKDTGNSAITIASCSWRIFSTYGVPAMAIETPDNLTGGGAIGNNDLRNCKLTKDLLINIWQSVCSSDEIMK